MKSKHVEMNPGQIRDDKFFRAAMAYLVDGGNVTDGIALIYRAEERLRDRDQPRVADEANATISHPATQHDMLGYNDEFGKSIPAAPAMETRGKGQIENADKATGFPPSPRVTTREPVSKRPGVSKRGLGAIASVQRAVSQSLFDTTKLPDGRTLREIRWSELPRLSRQYRSLSRIFNQIHNHATPADPNATVDAVVSEATLTEIMQRVELVNDIG
jgi:hypothetical protein